MSKSAAWKIMKKKERSGRPKKIQGPSNRPEPVFRRQVEIFWELV